MSLTLLDPAKTHQTLVTFIKESFDRHQKKRAIIAVSGGIDSSLALTLLTQALGAQQIVPLLLPYQNQNMSDAQEILHWNQIPEIQWQTIQIESLVAATARLVGLDDGVELEPFAKIRLGNLMARSRMMLVFDSAKKLDALVCGTENKSEHYLGYFTRFGDAASDIEPISTLYKTQVRALAQWLDLPAQLIQKPPSAGLWSEQTDESEMGFSYEIADQVLSQLIDGRQSPDQIVVNGVSPDMVKTVLAQVDSMAFKRMVPYSLDTTSTT